MDPQLEPLVDQYTSVIADMDAARNLLSSDVSARHDVEAAILTFLGDMRAHFSIEESSNGFFSTLLREAGAAAFVNKFRSEHQQLLRDATKLEQLVADRETDEPTWRAEVLRGLGELTQRFLEHERGEDQWLISNVPVKK